ncbi:MAG: hypothetical protein ACOC00_08775, partial [Halothiobacillaceae bacterium]
MDRLFEAFAEIADGLSALLKARGDSYVDLETCEFGVRKDERGQTHVQDLRTLVRPDGTLVTLFRIRGAQMVVRRQELPLFSKRIGDVLAQALMRPGHTVEIVYRRDMDTVYSMIDRYLRPARATARRLNMDVDWILDAKRDTLGQWCASESCWLAVSTDYRIFSSVESRQAGADRMRQVERNPMGRHSMNMAGAATSLRARHLALVGNMHRALNDAGVFAQILAPHEALHTIRREFDPEATAEDWRPLLPGDRLPVRFAQTANRHDPTSVLYPRLKQQLVPRAPGKVINNRWIEIGDRIHAPVAMSMPPQQVETFDALLAPLINTHTPFRISITLIPDGLGQINLLKKAISSVTDFLSTANKQFNAALEELQARYQSGETICGMRVIADTWVVGDDLEALRVRSEYLSKAIQSWGQSDTQDVVGDPLAGVSATIPGLTRVNPAPVSAPPLREITDLLPFSRPSSPWDAGALVFRSPDGKPLPYQPGSKLQTSWVTLGFAPMGKGKSVLLNAHNFALSLLDGLDRLPYISILDIGPSSTGLISLLKYSLPPDERYLVTHRKLRMRREDAINPFETPLGLRVPLKNHRAMLIEFLVTLAIPEGESRVQEGIPGMATQVVDMVFDKFAPQNQPKRFDARMDPKLTEVIEAHNIPVDEHSSWWEIEDALFERGLHEAAARAHRFAVPILADCAQV